MEVDDTASMYSGSVTFGIGSGRKNSLKENHHLDLETSYLYTSGTSSQTLATGQTVWGRWPDSISGPGVFPQKWQMRKVDVVAKYSRSISAEPDTNSIVFFSALAGLSRSEQSITLIDEAAGLRVSRRDVEISPMVGLGIGYQWNNFLTLNLDSRYSEALIDDQETIQSRFYLTAKPTENLIIQLGYQDIQFENKWDMALDLNGPWFSIGMDIR